MKLVHDLRGGGTDRRAEYYQWFVEQIQLENRVQYNDDIIFYLTRSVVKHNSRYCSVENPRCIDNVHVQYYPGL